MRISTCLKCEARIVMAKHVRTRKLAPIEVEPSDDGNIVLNGDEYFIVNGEMRELAIKRRMPLRKNHFATCEFAKSFSKQEREKPLPANVVRFPGR